MGYQLGMLWERVVETSRIALELGALQPIPTSFEFLEDGGVRFLIRMVEHLANKPENLRGTTVDVSNRNPFLPYDPALFVADAGAGHVCLLNKFNVVDHHLLIVTREFVHQDCPLDATDFAAWWRCLIEYDSLGFYNGGVCAGASQPHRHLQLIPLPLDESGPRIPIEPILVVDDPVPRLRTPDHRVPFCHALVGLEDQSNSPPEAVGQQLQRYYVDMLDLTGILAYRQPDGRLLNAYNLLLTRQWMLLVPRRHEHFAGISLNAMAFAGVFLTRDRGELERLSHGGPMAALSFVAGVGNLPYASLSNACGKIPHFVKPSTVK
jgi:sulfate adenylyltransferase (ADP) / ATP adenylyltransferase